jgi:transposase
MIRSGTIHTIHELSAQGKSIHAIARELGIARNTVRRYLRGKPEASPRHKRGSKLDAYKGQIHRWINEDHLLNCEMMLPRLQAMSYTGKSSTLRAYVHTLHPRTVGQAPMMRYETKPGEQMQFDWAEFHYEQQVGTLFIGNPHGVRQENKGRHHNQRMAQWEYGKDIDYLVHKSMRARIKSFTGSERGTSSQCPVCRHRHKPRGKAWRCRNCGFVGHRDVVGSVNMLQLAYNQQVTFPRSVTYLLPGEIRRSRRADTPRAS